MSNHPRLSLTTLEDRWTPTAGDLVTSFGDQGVFRLPGVPVAGGTEYTSIGQIAVTPDNRLVTLGSTFLKPNDPAGTTTSGRGLVARVLLNGQLDPTFGTNGLADAPSANAILVQPDGKILLSTLSGTANAFSVTRLTTDGRPDPGFGINGVASVAVAGGIPSILALRPDGRILVAGSATADAAGSQAFAVAQFTAGGRTDAGFGNSGVAVLAFPVGEFNLATAKAVALQSDGRVLLAGSVTVAAEQFHPLGGGTGTVLDTQFAVIRLNADGTPDQGFGTDGRARFSFGPIAFRQDQAAAVQVRPDGRIAVAGFADGSFGRYGRPSGPLGRAVAVLKPTGQLDPAFDGDGLVVSEAPFVTYFNIRSAMFLPDGGVQFLSSTGLVRLTANGQPDTVFGPDGAITSPLANTATNQAPSPFQLSAANLPDGTIAAVSVSDVSFGVGAVVRLRGTASVVFAPAVPGTVLAGGTPDGTATVLSPVSGSYTTTGGFTPYPNFPGTARTATADVTGDGVADYIVGPGPGGGPNVVVYDGKTAQKIANLDVFEGTFTGGVFVAAADLNGDGKAEVIVTPDQGGGPVVAIYDGAGLTAGKNEAAQLARFFGIDDPAFRGGARAALADVNADGTPDLVVAAGFGGGPRVAVFDGTAVTDRSRWTVRGGNADPFHMGGTDPVVTYVPKLVPDFFVFEDTLRNGVFVAAGDLTGDGAAEVIVGGGPGGGPRVFALDGRDLLAGRQTPVANFFAGDSTSRGGVRVAVRPDAAGRPQLVTGSGDGEAARVRVYKPATARSGGTADQELTPFGGAVLANGVFVG